MTCKCTRRPINVAAIATFTGDVSIGGTLTYEDVTNIDSIGIITARSNIDAQSDVIVGAGLSVVGISTLANTNINGQLTATNARITGVTTFGTSSTTINGAHEYPSIRPTLDLNFAATKTLDRRITFTRDSLGTYTDELGIIRTAPNNTPRFDHDPETGESLGLLIEESRTNDILNSQVFTSGYNTSGLNAITQNTTVTTPEGLTDGVGVITESSGGSVHQFYEASSAQITGIRTYSIFVKPNGRNYCVLRTSSFTHDLVNGTTLGSASGEYVSATTTKFANGWVRCTLTQNHSNTYDQFNFKLAKDGLNDYSYSGDGTSGVYVWGAQLEEGSFATSYIPTSGSTVTRRKDLVAITGTNFTDFYNQSEGAVVCKFGREQWAQADGDFERVWEIGDGTDNNNLNIFASASGQDLRYRVKTGGTNQFGATTSNIGSNLFPSVAMAYKQNDFAIIADGVVIDTDDGGDPPTVDRLHIGHNFNDVNTYLFNNTISYFKYYNKRLPNAQLQGLTAQ